MAKTIRINENKLEQIINKVLKEEIDSGWGMPPERIECAKQLMLRRIKYTIEERINEYLKDRNSQKLHDNFNRIAELVEDYAEEAYFYQKSIIDMPLEQRPKYKRERNIRRYNQY